MARNRDYLDKFEKKTNSVLGGEGIRVCNSGKSHVRFIYATLVNTYFALLKRE